MILFQRSYLLLIISTLIASSTAWCMDTKKATASTKKNVKATITQLLDNETDIFIKNVIKAPNINALFTIEFWNLPDHANLGPILENALVDNIMKKDAQTINLFTRKLADVDTATLEKWILLDEKINSSTARVKVIPHIKECVQEALKIKAARAPETTDNKKNNKDLFPSKGFSLLKKSALFAGTVAAFAATYYWYSNRYQAEIQNFETPKPTKSFISPTIRQDAEEKIEDSKKEDIDNDNAEIENPLSNENFIVEETSEVA